MTQYKLLTRHVCMTRTIGIHNNLFGGVMLSWLDEAGAIFASELIGSPRVVTLKMSEVLFKNPVKEGNIIYIYGSVLKIGKTSVTIILEAKRKDVETSEEEIVCTTELVFVHIQQNGVPQPIQEDKRKMVISEFNLTN